MYCPLKIDPAELQPRDYSAVRARIEGAGVAYRENKARVSMAKFMAEQERHRLVSTLAKYREINCNPGPRVVIAEISRKHGIDAKEIVGATRMHKIVVARMEAMYEVRKRFPSYSLPRIGRLFGDRDHTTVMHAVKTHARRNNLPLPVSA